MQYCNNICDHYQNRGCSEIKIATALCFFMDNLATVSRKNSQICHSSRRLSKHCAEALLRGTARVGQAVTVAEQIGDDAGEHIEVVAVGERGAVGTQPFKRAVLLGSVVLTQPVEEANAAAHHLVQPAAVQSVGAEDIVFRQQRGQIGIISGAARAAIAAHAAL